MDDLPPCEGTVVIGDVALAKDLWVADAWGLRVDDDVPFIEGEVLSSLSGFV